MARVERWSLPTYFGLEHSYVEVDDDDLVVVPYPVLADLMVDRGWVCDTSTVGASPENR